MNPALLVIAGPNGAGKTTVTARLRADHRSEGVEYLNPDDVARVADRVIRGGHTVPIEKIVTRYERSLANLPLAIGIAHRVYVFDNSVDGVEARLCARIQDGQLRTVYGDLPTWVGAAVERLPHHPAFVDLRRAG